eukprot:m.5285 g.5285  ORF g.5285 m.5285 type:complete len:67 (+) comp4183_c0_seq1:63-263(+)
MKQTEKSTEGIARTRTQHTTYKTHKFKLNRHLRHPHMKTEVSIGSGTSPSAAFYRLEEHGCVFQCV